jgi:polygalacturonase
MDFSLLSVTCCSATIEMTNDAIFQCPKPFSVRLNEKAVLTTSRNVFTLFDLTPDTDYRIRIGSSKHTFHTKAVSAILHLKDFAKGTSASDDTLRIQTAVALTPKNGLLIVDDGDYHLTTLFLKSHMTISFAKNAHFYGNTDVNAYATFPGEVPSSNPKKPLELGTWEGNPFLSKTSLLSGYEIEDVTLVGQGLIDGEAQHSAFWDDVKNLTYSRPRLLFLVRCQRIAVIGLSFANAPCWTIHPYFSDHISFLDLFISNPKDSPNTDGINPECCQDVKIIGVRFSVGDDCIALKSGKISIGSTFQKPTRDVIIRNCAMNEGHGAIVLGSEAGAGLKNLLIEQCLFHHTDRGFRIKSRRGRGKDSRIDNIIFRNIRMENVLTPLVINMFYFCDPDGKSDYVQNRAPAPVDERTPYLGHFTFEKMVCTDCEVALGYFFGLPERPIGAITIRDCSFTVRKDATPDYPAMMCGIPKMSQRGFIFENVNKVTLANITAKGYQGEEATFTNVKEVNKA